MSEPTCPDCGKPLDIQLGELPEIGAGLLAMVLCDTCAGMRRDHGKHTFLLRDAIQGATEAGRKIVKLDKMGRLGQLNANQKEELWNLQQKLEQNLRWYHSHKQEAEMLATRYQARTGLEIQKK